MLNGWVLARRGHAIEGLTAMRRALDAHRRTGAVVGVTHFLTLLAELHGFAGHIETGLRTADEALALAITTGNRYLEPDIRRVRGDLLVRLAGAGDAGGPGPTHALADAERCFRQALDLARRRAARSLELRAATSLARLWHGRGESARARRLLGPVCRAFVEGAVSADLTAAEQILGALDAPRPASARALRAARRPAGRTRRHRTGSDAERPP